MTMEGSTSTPEPAQRPLNHLGFVENSVQRVVDGSCRALDASFDAAVHYSGDTCRPRVVSAKQQSSEFARRTAESTKESTAKLLKKLDPTVDSAITSARATTVRAQDVFDRVDKAADQAASHPRVQQSYHYAKDKYASLHEKAVASPTYKKVYSTAADSMTSMSSKVRSSQLYAERIAPYTEPLVQKVASSQYCKAAVEHIRPAHMAEAPAQGAARGPDHA